MKRSKRAKSTHDNKPVKVKKMLANMLIFHAGDMIRAWWIDLDTSVPDFCMKKKQLCTSAQWPAGRKRMFHQMKEDDQGSCIICISISAGSKHHLPSGFHFWLITQWARLRWFVTRCSARNQEECFITQLKKIERKRKRWTLKHQVLNFKWLH